MKKIEKPKKNLILSILFFVVMSLLVVRYVQAQAGSLEIEAEPSSTWIGGTVTISCWYTDNVTDATNPLVHINKGEVVYSPLIATSINDTHFYTHFDPSLLGTYHAYCSNGTVDSSQASFKISDLDVSSSDVPEVVYLGNPLTLHAEVVKTTDSEELICSSDVNFKIFLGSNEDSNEIPLDHNNVYCDNSNHQWTITTDPISDIATKDYILTLNATYAGKTVTFSQVVEVKESLEFEIVDIDKTWIRSNETITITIRAMESGEPITPLQSSYLKFQVNSIDSIIFDISQSGDLSFVKISTPELASGTYELKTTFTYKDYTYIDKKSISYVVPVTGNILDSDDKPVSVRLKFSNEETEQTISTNSDGSYSGTIPPGTYELKLTFPSSTLHLTDVVINSFDDPIRFDHPTTDAEIPGIKVADVFVYEVALSYSEAQLEMKYDDRKVFDETKIDIYECDNWNFGRKTCYSEWERVYADIDIDRDLIKVNTTGLSAFVIGSKKDIQVDFDTDKSTYNLKDIIKIVGLTKDEDGSAIAGVDINVTIQDTEISASTKSDNSGVFSLEFLSPDEEGNYKLVLNAEKPPSAPFEETLDLSVVRSKGLSILMTDTTRIEQGENRSVEVSIINSGQTDFSNLTISLANIPSGYYDLPTSIDQLLAGEEKKIWILFTVPESATKTTYSGKIKVASDDVSKEQSFALTILPANKTQTDESKGSGAWFPVINFPTANIVLPEFGIEAVYISLFAITSFSFAYWAKKKKLRKKIVERSDIKNFLLDIKREVNRIPTKITKDENTTSKLSENKKISKSKKPSEDNTKFKELFNLLDKIRL